MWLFAEKDRLEMHEKRFCDLVCGKKEWVAFENGIDERECEGGHHPGRFTWVHKYMTVSDRLTNCDDLSMLLNIYIGRLA